jgi:GntR family transcriptional repressor for pyruvate dehydrogenase complex
MPVEFPKIGHRERHSEQIYWTMVDWIAETEAQPGDRLPNENELAERFAVSRPTMREALRVLEYSGLVESRRGRNGGLFAGQGATPQVIGAIRTLFIIGNRSRENLFEARMIVEVGVARAAALQITDEQLALLAESIEQMTHGANSEQVRAANDLFHMTIVEAVDNDILRAIMIALMSLFNEVAAPGPDDPETHELRLKNHRDIYEALASRQPPRAAEAMHRHLTTMEARAILLDDAPVNEPDTPG